MRISDWSSDVCSSDLILIFNVDSGPKGAFLEVDDDTFAAANTNNVMAFRWAVQAVVPHMQARGWGRILTIGTNSVKAPHRKLARAAQNTYRVGALALSKTLSAELGPMGITEIGRAHARTHNTK